ARSGLAARAPTGTARSGLAARAPTDKVIDVTDPGWPEAEWLARPELAGAPPMIWSRPPARPGRVVVVAPHPDDEVLGVGATMVHFLRDGWRVEVVTVTDGEAADPEATPEARRRLGALRLQEQRRAWQELGLDGVGAHHLHLPDGGLDRVEDELASALAGLIRAPGRPEGPGPAAWLLATWRGDGHPDHEAVGRAAAEAVASTSTSTATSTATATATATALAEYPVWTWQWARPGDERVPWSRARRVMTAPADAQAKSAAIGAFASQVGPAAGQDMAVLPPHVVARFLRPFEVLLVGEPT
ncbi:MAG: PIG-L deacetylase family protein, partial [Acidimicrobiales bacterium]